ncbi:MAG: DUF4242 domain-containing protein [Candidatus Dormibacteraeota bacterium]|nr:DUF4242 domain-containing protein [Candidatus Dormibacteraeota bacterium]
MPLFMDHHAKVDGPVKDAVTGANARHPGVEKKHGVRFLKCWFAEDSARVYYLLDAPNSEAAQAAHREAHGLIPDDITTVQEGI